MHMKNFTLKMHILYHNYFLVKQYKQKIDYK
jgi:hypothetical protein